MPGAELRASRKQLGLSQARFARLMRLGRHGERTVGRWERGEARVPGPVAVAVELMLGRMG